MPNYPKVATPTEVWNNAARTLTAITGQPRTDLVGQDNDLEATTGTRIAKVDNVDVVVSTRALEAGGRLDSVPAFLAPAESSILMDGLEKILVEVTDIKAGEIEAWVDLTPMAGGDTIIIRYSRKMKAAGVYAKYAEETYSDAQTIPALCVLSKKIYRDTKVTAQQSTGSYKTLDIQVIRTSTA